MVHFVPLTKQQHGSKALRKVSGYDFARSVSQVRISGNEFFPAASSMPVAFVEEAGSYTPVALLSLVAGRNLFVAPDGRWLGRYIPATLRSYPLRLLARAAGSDERVLCIDEQCPGIVDSAGAEQSFFTAEGELSDWLKPIFGLMQAMEQSHLQTTIAVAALARAGVFCPWDLKVKVADWEQKVVNLHRVDEVALNRLSDDVFLDLRKTSALPLAYAHLMSLAQVEVLERLMAMQASLAQQQHSATTGQGESSFNLSNEDSLHFG